MSLKAIILRRILGGWTPVCYIIIFLKQQICEVIATQTVVPDHFVFGVSVSGVYKYQLVTINEMKAVIRQEVTGIMSQIIHLVMLNFINRLQTRITIEGNHMNNTVAETYFN